MALPVGVKLRTRDQDVDDMNLLEHSRGEGRGLEPEIEIRECPAESLNLSPCCFRIAAASRPSVKQIRVESLKVYRPLGLLDAISFQGAQKVGEG